MTIPNKADEAKRPAAVYRLYAADGTLLYIGSSYNPDARCEVHRRRPWWREVARRTEEWHPFRGAAYWAETKAIRIESPKFNRAGTPAHNAERSLQQQGTADEQRVKCKVAADALKIRKRVAGEWRAKGYGPDRSTAEGMLAERAYKELSGAFPNGVAYPSLEQINERLKQAEE